MLLVDPDARRRSVLAARLRTHEDLVVGEADGAAAALKCLSDRSVDLVLADLDLPDMEGHELCRVLRARRCDVPIVVLVLDAAAAEAVLALEAGAVDCIERPPRLPVLLARLRAHLRLRDRSETAHLPIAGYTFRPASRMLVDSGAGARIPLTDKEAAILKQLYRAGGRPVPRRILLERIWGYGGAVETHTLETNVYRLRRKIRRDIVITEPDGYRLGA